MEVIFSVDLMSMDPDAFNSPNGAHGHHGLHLLEIHL
jgi:hypothetical protein